MTDSTAVPDEAAALPSLPATPFIRALVGLIRAEDGFGAWETLPDSHLLREYVVTKEQRRAIPIIGDPDPDILNRVGLFYRAAGLAVERETGLMAVAMMSMSHEGFGRVILGVGKLIAYSRTLRDVHRYGFDSFEAMSAEGMRVVAQVAADIAAHPEVARA